MLIPNDILAADWERQFADWGVEVLFREVAASYDPQTQSVNESFSDTPVTAIVQEADNERAPNTNAQQPVERIAFLVRVSELPSATPATTSRVVHLDAEYDVVNHTLSADGLVRRLECSRTT